MTVSRGTQFRIWATRTLGEHLLPGYTPSERRLCQRELGEIEQAAPLAGQPDRWSRYIRDSLIETTIARDVLLLSRVDKPPLLLRA